MYWQIIHIIDILLWIFIAASVMYVAFFAIISIISSQAHQLRSHNSQFIMHNHGSALSTPQSKNHKLITNKYLILFPAYNEDKVIVSSVKTFLQQTYNSNLYHIVVISDHMRPETNATLSQLPITLLQPVFEKSSKAKAMQYAIANTKENYDKIVILDADNIVEPSFLEQLNSLCNQDYRAIQCHRCAKNNNNDIAALDGVSEEINNTLFRRAHNAVGLSSALIGSGMCFDYPWFAENVQKLSTAGEDRELEALLLKQNIFIKYAEHIHVYDEKVSNGENFQRQRLRWMTAQIQALLSMLPYIPHAIITGNINYIDKTLQQAMIPRSILLVATLFFSIVMSIIVPVWSFKWWMLFVILVLSLIIAIPARLRTRSLFGKSKSLLNLTFRMLRNTRHIKKDNKDFLHTDHG